nr:MAG TPA: hypothetical protein [Crassvirales sp.]
MFCIIVLTIMQFLLFCNFLVFPTDRLLIISIRSLFFIIVFVF